MRVLLTGGCGYIGSHIFCALSEAGHYPVIVDNLSNATISRLEEINSVTGSPVPFVRADVRSREDIEAVLRDHEIEAVIHLAGLKSVADSVLRPTEYYSNNVMGTLTLLQAMQSANVKSLVFSSSATVYGRPEYLPFDENHVTSPQSPYGRSKLHSELMMKDLVRADPNWRVLCLRYFNPVGAHPSGMLGELPSGEVHNLMPRIIQVASERGTKLTIFGQDYPTIDGTGVRDYVDVMDISDGHLSALEYLSEREGWYAMNLGTGKGFSVLEVKETFTKATGVEVPHEFMPRRAGDIDTYFADSNLAKRELGWVARRSLSQSCQSAWFFYKNRG